MRVLVIGFPLPNPRIDNYSFIQAPSFFDYDAVVVESAAVSRVIEDVLTRSEDHQTFAGDPVLNEPSGPFVTGLADHLQRRRDEAERLLAAGKLLIVFARPNTPHSHILGFPGYDRYSWLPAPAGVIYRPPQLNPADGRNVSLVDPTHPLAEIIERFGNWFTYRATFAESLPAFPEQGRVIMRSPGGAAVGVELRVGPGTIVLLPALEDVASGDPRFELATMLVNAVQRWYGGETEADAPPWAGEYTLPELATHEAALSDAESELRRAQERVNEARARVSGLANLRKLLWAEGEHNLAPAVRAALEQLGFSLELGQYAENIAYADGRTLYYEVEGAREQVKEEPYIRLQRRLEKEMLSSGNLRKGLIVANGRRRTHPDRREEPFSRQLLIACENYRFALTQGPALFEMVRIALTDGTMATRRQLRDAIFDAAGLVDLYPFTAPPAPTAVETSTDDAQPPA